MREIVKLVDIITSKTRGNISMLDLTGEIKDPSKEQQLYNGVLSEIYDSDENAAEGMYGTDPTDQRFRMLKSRLRQKLYNFLYFIDFKDSKSNMSFQYEQECFDYLHKARILFKNGEYDMAEKQINKVLSISREVEFNRITADSLEILREIFSDLCKPTDLNKVIEELSDLRKLISHEERAKDLYFQQKMLLNKSLHSRKNNIETTGEIAKQLNDIWADTKSFDVFELYYKMNLLYLELTGNFQEILKFTNQAKKLVDSKKINEMRFDARLNDYMKTFAYLRIGDFKSGLQAAKEGIVNLDKSSRNWFAFMENYYLLAMHTGDYKLAESLVQQAEDNTVINRLSIEVRGKWKLFRGFTNLLIGGKHPSDGIRIEKIKQKLESFKKTNKVTYTSLLTLDIIDQLSKKKYDAVSNALNELNLYYFEFLNEPGKNPREKQLFKLLKLVVSSDFNAGEMEKKGKKYHENLIERPQDDPMSEMEIIPYEKIWECIVGIVKLNEKEPSFR